jgi:HAD superfamily hydrolase (TIGR01662 family)
MSLIASSNHQPIRAVLFDLGSTLIYFDSSWNDVIPEENRALLAALDHAGIPVDPVQFPDAFHRRMDAYYDEREIELIEHTTSTILRNLLADVGYAQIPDETLRQILSELYSATQAHWHAEEDAAPTLSRLKELGYRLAVISNASDDDDVQTLIDKAALRPTLDVVVTSAAAGIRKPNPRVFQMALGQLGVPPTQAVMVGDMLGADILGARGLGIQSIWITRRADTESNRGYLDTIQPDASVETLSAIPEIVEKWNQERRATGAMGCSFFSS